jgi:F-type H+-transporting ATPase subunit alpha
MEKTIVVVSTIFDSLVMSYLAPYVGCSLAEYIWQAVGNDAVIIYDDLTTHAQTHREISLLSGVSPGRDSYPGDMFHVHSQLMERAGKLNKSHKCLTAIPLALADGGDITAYLPTNLMSMTDGQWILDMDIFRGGLRPSINVGLSVTRVGGRGHNKRQQKQNGDALQALTAYAQAQEFAHFGSELALATRSDISRGRMLHKLMTQTPGETYSLLAQQMILDIALEPNAADQIDVTKLKSTANEAAQKLKTEGDYELLRDQLKEQSMKSSGTDK